MKEKIIKIILREGCVERVTMPKDCNSAVRIQVYSSKGDENDYRFRKDRNGNFYQEVIFRKQKK